MQLQVPQKMPNTKTISYKDLIKQGIVHLNIFDVLAFSKS